MPLRRQLHVDKLLSEISVKYSSSEFIADKVFPVLSVQKDTDLFRVYERNFRLPHTARADGGLANQDDFNVSTSSYALQWHALKSYISDNQADNYDIGDLRADAVQDLTDKIGRRMEKSFCDLFTKTSWSLNVSLAANGTFADNTTTVNPIVYFDTAATTVIQNSGMKPNVAAMNRDGLIAIKNHQLVLDRVKYTSSDVSTEMLAGLFGLEKIHVSTVQLDSAVEGASASIGHMFPDAAWVGYSAPRPSPMSPSAGYIFKKARPEVKRWRDEEREAEAIEVNMQYDVKVVASLAGYLIVNVS